MNRLRQSHAAALVAVVVTGLAVVYTLALILGMPDPSWAPVLRLVFHAGELAAVVGLALCGAAGSGTPARIGLGAAVLGQVLLAVAEVVVETAPGLGETLFGIGPVLVALGLITAGVMVIRTGIWGSPRRWGPLTLGVYVLAVMTPVLIASGGPPAVAALWALAGWETLWLLVAVSVLLETAGARGRQEASAELM